MIFLFLLVMRVKPHGNKAVGYQSYLMQDSGRTVVAQAYRVHEKYRKLGASKHFRKLTKPYLAIYFKDIKHVPVSPSTETNM